MTETSTTAATSSTGPLPRLSPAELLGSVFCRLPKKLKRDWDNHQAASAAILSENALLPPDSRLSEVCGWASFRKKTKTHATKMENAWLRSCTEFVFELAGRTDSIEQCQNDLYSFGRGIKRMRDEDLSFDTPVLCRLEADEGMRPEV